MVRFFLILFLVGVGTFVHGESHLQMQTTIPVKSIVQIDNLDLFEKITQTLDSDSLVLFDVDDTLLVPNDVVLKPCGRSFIRKFISDVLENSEHKEKYPDGYLYSKVLSTRSSSLVDPRSVQLVKALQTRGIPTLALTAAAGGKLGVIESLADWRINELKTLGFDFSALFAHSPYLEFPKASECTHSPVFKSGILFSSEHPKGDTLKAFIHTIQWTPKKVVFIDDNISYLQSVEQAMNEMEIEFIGFHYTAAEKGSPLEERLAELQFNHLAEHGEWLSDDQAKQLLIETEV